MWMSDASRQPADERVTTSLSVIPERLVDRQERVRVRWWEAIAVFLAALALLWGLTAYFDNVHRATTNGLWKSIDVNSWLTPGGRRYTDGGNLLYFPGLATMLRLLPEQWFGTVWQRMAYVNGLFGGGVIALTYLIAVRLFQSRSTALFGCLLQLSMGFFLLLSTINEDIMPGYFFFVAAVAVAVVPRSLSPLVIICAAQCVAMSWLLHSSLQLPAIGAFIIGIMLWAGNPRDAARRVLLFCAALIPLPAVSALAFGLPWTAGFWAGKGVGTGWGGFAVSKLAFMWIGVAQSVFGGRNVASIADLVALHLSTSIWTMLLAGLMFGLWLWSGRQQRDRAEWRLSAGLLVAVFLLGEGMNLYIQPQDPQMQLQPMTWFPFAGASAFALAGRLAPGLGVACRTALVAGTMALAVGNVQVYADARFKDSEALRNVRTLEELAPPSRTVFMFHGFEGMATWLTASWGQGSDAPRYGTPEAARFNVIYLVNEAVATPNRPAADSAANVQHLVEAALEQGFDVIASDIWNASEQAWIDSFVTISGPEKPRAIRSALHERFVGTPIQEVPGWGAFYRIARKTAAP